MEILQTSNKISLLSKIFELSLNSVVNLTLKCLKRFCEESTKKKSFYMSDDNIIHYETPTIKKTCCLCCQCVQGYSPNVTLRGHGPIRLTCPNCRIPMKTQVLYINYKRTNIAACLLSPIGLCLLPYCLPCCKRVRHRCPLCGAYIGTSQ